MRAVVGIDLRAASHDWLVQRASQYALRIGAKIDLVYFVEGSELPEFATRLAAMVALLPEACRGTSVVRHEAPSDGLVALSNQYDLLVVGSREPPALERLLRGMMAARVLRYARCPVLVPRQTDEIPPSPRLLVGVDVEGPAPSAVLKWAEQWAGKMGGTVHVVYAASVHRGDWLSVRDEKTKQLEALLASHIAKEHRGGAIVRRGEAEEALVAASTEYDLLLVGNRDREGLARLVLGAVAGSIVRRAACDVLSLPTATQ